MLWKCLLCLSLALPLASQVGWAQSCAGDCNEDGRVTVDELVRGVQIALGRVLPAACSPLDRNDDAAVSIDEMIGAVVTSLDDCGRDQAASGRCLMPGPSGLVPCNEGMSVRVSRCNDPSRCLDDPAALTVLDFGAIAAGGQFRLSFRAGEASGAALVFEAEIDDSGTTFRTLDFGLLSGGGAGVEGEVLITPTSEAATQILADNGLQNFAADDASAIVQAIAGANSETEYAGLTPAEAVVVSEQVAIADPGVLALIVLSRFTPTPTPPPTPTGPTPTPFPPRADLLNGAGGNEWECTLDKTADLLSSSTQFLADLASLDGETTHTLFKTVYVAPGLAGDDVVFLRPMVAPGGFIDDFVRAGGAAVIHLAGPGLATSEPNLAPGGVGFARSALHNSEAIAAPDHPLITGAGYGGVPLSASSFASWGPTDEGVLTDLPPEAIVILQNSQGPSLAEYPLGDGKVIVSTLTFCTASLVATQGDALDNLLRYSVFFEGLARTPGLTLTPTITPTLPFGSLGRQK